MGYFYASIMFVFGCGVIFDTLSMCLLIPKLNPSATLVITLISVGLVIIVNAIRFIIPEKD